MNAIKHTHEELDELLYIGMWCRKGMNYGSLSMGVIYSDCVGTLILDDSTGYFDGYILMRFSAN